MATFRDLFLTKKVYFVIFFIFIVLVLMVVMMYKYGIMPSFLNFNSSSLVKIIPATYTDSKYNFKLIYPANTFTFKEQAAKFIIYDREKEDVSIVEVGKNTQFNLAITSFPEDSATSYLVVNPIDLYLSVLDNKIKNKGIDQLVNEDKSSCSELYDGKSGPDCEIEKLSAEDGRPIYILRGWANNFAGNVTENVYLPYNDNIIKLNFIYSEIALKAKHPDATLRQNMIVYIISNSFKVNFK